MIGFPVCFEVQKDEQPQAENSRETSCKTFLLQKAEGHITFANE